MGSIQELGAPYRCKVEQSDALQHNGMTNFETENVHVEVRL